MSAAKRTAARERDELRAEVERLAFVQSERDEVMHTLAAVREGSRNLLASNAAYRIRIAKLKAERSKLRAEVERLQGIIDDFVRVGTAEGYAEDREEGLFDVIEEHGLEKKL